MSAIAEKVRTIVSDALRVDIVNVIPSAHLADDLGADGLDQTLIALEVEAVFELDVPDEVMASMISVGDLIAHVEKAVG